MKKYVIALIACLLCAALCCGCALAAYGDVTVKAVKAWADAEMTVPLGRIPKYTAVVVRDIGYGIARLSVNGVTCYVANSALGQSVYDYKYKGYSVLKSGSRVWQRPASGSRSISTSKEHVVLVCAVKGGWVLIRSGFGGYFGFVRRSSLNGFAPAD